MKITDIIWEEGRTYEDNEGIVWEVARVQKEDSEDYSFNLISYTGISLHPYYSIYEIATMDFTESVNWVLVPEDSKVLVSNDGVKWVTGHFCRYNYSHVPYEVYSNGKTSFTAMSKHDVTNWKYCELASTPQVRTKSTPKEVILNSSNATTRVHEEDDEEPLTIPKKVQRSK